VSFMISIFGPMPYCCQSSKAVCPSIVGGRRQPEVRCGKGIMRYSGRGPCHMPGDMTP
jgi:hypothetical protein